MTLPAVTYRDGGAGAGAFTTRIPLDAKADVSSALVVSRMRSSMRKERCFLSFGSSLYVSGADDPAWQLVCREAGFPASRPFVFHAPEKIQPGTLDADMPLTVYDRRIATAIWQLPEVRCWRAQVDRRALRVTCEGMGVFDAGRCSDGLPQTGWGTGCGLSSSVGLITGEEVALGEIPHALRLVGPNGIDGARWRLPARKSDQNGDGPLQMGMRLRVQMTDAEIRARTVPGDDPKCRRLLWMICRALRDYGAIVVDGSGSETLYGLLMESEESVAGRHSGGWRALAGQPVGGYWGNVIRDRLADSTGDRERRGTDGVPWERAQVLERSVW